MMQPRTTIKAGGCFFSWRWESGMPYLVHFYVGVAQRSAERARAWVRFTLDYFRLRGHRALLLNVPERKRRVKLALEYFFKVKPYAFSDGHYFYCVEVK